MPYHRNIVEDGTITLEFSTEDGNGQTISFTGTVANIKILKNGVERATNDGITLNKDINPGTGAIPGLHELVIDTSVDTGDVGFWVPGQYYQVLAKDIVLSGITRSVWLPSFTIEDQVLTAREVQAATANKLADHVWRRQTATVRASGDGDALAFRSGLGMLSKLVNKVSINTTPTPDRLEIMEEDDTTVFGEQEITTDASADPVTGLDTV